MRNLFIRVKSEEQLRAVQKWGNADVLIADSSLESKIGRDREKTVFSLPDVLREERLESVEKIYENCRNAGGFLIKSLDELGLLTEKNYEGRVIADSFLYTYNSEAADFYLVYYPEMQFVCSDELTDREMLETANGLSEGKKDGKIYDRFIYKIYGYQPLMITNQCVSRNYTSCKDKKLNLKDDKGNNFIAQSCCSQCYSIIYNGNKTVMMDKLGEIPYSNLLVDFTIENSRDTEEVLKELDKIISDENNKENSESAGQFSETKTEISGLNMKNGITRGHHYKGVD